MSDAYDFVVVGAGPVGENVAQYATQGSDRTAVLIERELVGGECSYYACMPSKALLRPVDLADVTAHVGGVRAATLDVDATLRRRDEWVHGYDDASQVSWAEDAGIDVVRGDARVTGEREVTITLPDGGARRITAREAVVVAAGSEPVIPGEYDGVHPWTSRDATGVREVPARLAIVGGGVVACEAARWLRALGSDVTMLVRDRRLLARTEQFAGDLVAEALRSSGVDVRFGAEVRDVRRDAAEATGLGRLHGGPVTLRVGGGDLVVDEVLVATGRRPRRPVDVDADGASAWLHWVGDASGEAPLTHWGKYRARVLGEQLAARAAGRAQPAVPDDVPVPQVVFTDPQVAAVGATLAEAQRRGSARAVDVPLTSVAGAALIRDDLVGQARLVVDADDRLVGATFVGPEVAELLHAATVAIVGKLSLDVLWHAVPSYPTASEVWLRLLEAARG
ncbi:dihydrolipoyl dehydrogenase family protein [Cumulibacter manganitolerans]|uniref:dihydrolipoyl dehydrogenase family protein n=1 Tax=Cumulibacter manganitolerans TaxID=1884992 RepID=UPI0012948BF8|nr:NAD(P)/FAD-dependent oxidoreductase [Cumulibacter manganitolerans]